MAKTTSKSSKTKTAAVKSTAVKRGRPPKAAAKKAAPKKKPAAITLEAEVPAANDTMAVTKASNNRMRLILAAAVLVLLLGAGTWKYLDQQRQLKELKSSQKSAAELEKELVDEVSKIAVVPVGEDPIIREVESLEAVAGQPFYSQSKVGDRVLLYSNAKRAILYRPSTKQIVNISNNIVIRTSDSQQPPDDTTVPAGPTAD